MTDNQKIAYEWAKSHDYPSIAARYARELAGLVDDLQGAYDAMVRDLTARTRQVRQLQGEISALRQQHFREVTKKVEPLTLEELRKLPIRDWAWIEILNPDAFRSKETVSAYYRKYDGYKKDEIFWCGYPGLGFGFDYADYGKTWLAYRQKPEEGTV